jgi:hypothetical protein
VMPAPLVVLRPVDVMESCWKAAPSPVRGDIRSVTPAGFARAVFEANQAIPARFTPVDKGMVIGSATEGIL